MAKSSRRLVRRFVFHFREYPVSARYISTALALARDEDSIASQGLVQVTGTSLNEQIDTEKGKRMRRRIPSDFGDDRRPRSLKS